MAEKHGEEFELIPMSPIRRLEKRLEQVEANAGSGNRDFMKDLLDVVRMNQQIVDELAKSNDALRIELSKLPGRLEDLINSMHELLSYIKASATEEMMVSPNVDMKPLADKLDQLIEGNKKIVETNQSLMGGLDELERKLRPPMPPMPPQMRRPLPPLKPIT
jgi:translation elongation factor EF-G